MSKNIFYIKTSPTKTEVLAATPKVKSPAYNEVVAHTTDNGDVTDIEVFEHGKLACTYHYLDNRNTSMVGNELRWVEPNELLRLVRTALLILT